MQTLWIATLMSSLISVTKAAYHEGHAKMDDLMTDLISNDGLIYSKKSRSKISCIRDCLDHPTCVSNFYLAETRACQLHDAILNTVSNAVSQSNGFKYYIHQSRKTELVNKGYIFEENMKIWYRIALDNNMYWNDHRDICTSEGGHLFTITSQSTQTWVENLIQNTPGAGSVDIIHVDGTEAGHVGTWTEFHGTEFPWTNWGKSQPNNNQNFGDQDCLCLYKNSAYKWDDTWCHTDSYSQSVYICQVDT